jgi:hypothetical protein
MGAVRKTTRAALLVLLAATVGFIALLAGLLTNWFRYGVSLEAGFSLIPTCLVAGVAVVLQVLALRGRFGLVPPGSALVHNCHCRFGCRWLPCGWPSAIGSPSLRHVHVCTSLDFHAGVMT